MNPKLFLSLTAGTALLATLIFGYGDEIFSLLLDKSTQNDLGELLGITRKDQEDSDE
jgi:hypothetical protein